MSELESNLGIFFTLPQNDYDASKVMHNLNYKYIIPAHLNPNNLNPSFFAQNVDRDGNLIPEYSIKLEDRYKEGGEIGNDGIVDTIIINVQPWNLFHTESILIQNLDGIDGFDLVEHSRKIGENVATMRYFDESNQSIFRKVSLEIKDQSTSVASYFEIYDINEDNIVSNTSFEKVYSGLASNQQFVDEFGIPIGVGSVLTQDVEDFKINGLEDPFDFYQNNFSDWKIPGQES
jgi:hypothetical protein